MADGKLTLKGEIEAASKAEKLEWKPQEEQVDAFGNIVKIKVSLHMFSLCLHTACTHLLPFAFWSLALVHMLQHLFVTIHRDQDRLGIAC